MFTCGDYILHISFTHCDILYVRFTLSGDIVRYCSLFITAVCGTFSIFSLSFDVLDNDVVH